MAEKNHKQIKNEIKRLMIDCTYSGRSHQIIGQRWMLIYYMINIPGSILGAVLGVGAAGSALYGVDSKITATLAIISVTIIAVRDLLKPDKQANAHIVKGGMYVSIRNRGRILKDLEIGTANELEIISRIRELRSEYDLLNLKQPNNIYKWAYRATKKSIKKGESDYEKDILWKTFDRE